MAYLRFDSVGISALSAAVPKNIIDNYKYTQYFPVCASNEYSPLFVDLIDDYNQYENDIYLPNDRINNVPHSLMREIAQEDYNWAECKSRLVSKIGVYYTEEDVDGVKFDVL